MVPIRWTRFEDIYFHSFDFLNHIQLLSQKLIGSNIKKFFASNFEQSKNIELENFY